MYQNRSELIFFDFPARRAALPWCGAQSLGTRNYSGAAFGASASFAACGMLRI